MDHRQIDEQGIADRYLKHELTAQERDHFEAHLADCSECIDRLLLAEMFHARNGTTQQALPPPAPTPPEPPVFTPAPVETPEPLPSHIEFLAQFRAWQLLALLMLAMVAMALPTALWLWLSAR